MLNFNLSRPYREYYRYETVANETNSITHAQEIISAE